MQPIKVPKEHVDAIVAGLTFDHHHYPGTNYIVAIAKDAFGYVHAHGFSSCVDPDGFVLQQGIDIATRNAKAAAVSAIWEKESYKLLSEVKQKHITRTQISLDLGENHPDPQGAVNGIVSDWNAELRWPKPSVPATVLGDGSVITDAQVSKNIVAGLGNVRAHGAPIVDPNPLQVTRDGLITRECRVWPWWRNDRSNDLFSPAVREARGGGMTAPIRTGQRALNLKELCGTDQPVYVHTIDRVFIALGDEWFSFSVSSKAPGNRVFNESSDAGKQRLSIHLPAGIFTGTELHTSSGYSRADLGDDSVSFVVSLEIASNANDGRLVVLGYINDVHVKNNSGGWNARGNVVEDYVRKLKDATASSVVAVELYTTILGNVSGS